jgi:GNAT superfamily N-acetyltransferase
MVVTKGSFTITTDKEKFDIDCIHGFLSTSYWAEGIPRETVQRSIEGSLCFGIFEGESQVGFARMITDGATFAYLADVFVIESYRGRGLSKWLMEVILQHQGLQGLRRMILATRDAHGLYSQFGFTPLNNPERWMQIHKPDVYKTAQR